MVDARWYEILKEFEYVSKIEREANPAPQPERDTEAPRLSRKQRVGLVLTTSLLAAILIAILPAV